MRKPIIALATLGLLLAACAKPLPPDKAAYAGEWDSPTMALLITQGGSVAYKRVEGNSSTSINAPLKAFVGNDFVVGVAGGGVVAGVGVGRDVSVSGLPAGSGASRSTSLREPAGRRTSSTNSRCADAGTQVSRNATTTSERNMLPFTTVVEAPPKRTAGVPKRGADVAEALRS